MIYLFKFIISIRSSQENIFLPKVTVTLNTLQFTTEYCRSANQILKLFFSILGLVSLRDIQENGCERDYPRAGFERDLRQAHFPETTINGEIVMPVCPYNKTRMIKVNRTLTKQTAANWMFLLKTKSCFLRVLRNKFLSDRKVVIDSSCRKIK